ncbi:hypothetical protein QF117_09135 [Vibrio sp. YMD68]|uniref:hypothetical protein n=1 Tax=Vibrio sp. YMD68 TaxID=3042300 RepID=UPI00249C9104|nr:hypothetical protein [Vibrio sp. YMD68]WGW00354.1 hypothetical protein QF117_21240 [Vibrio sp. YMD68]WGW00965.1 hypothetical protein QF117_09135 [Vibrio sp. YMD68]
MKKLLNYLTQASTWEGLATAALTIGAVADVATTGGIASGVLAAVGAIASTTSIARDDRKGK